eukprot:5905690-Pyramimonas_sp.AAC.1
MWSRTFFVCSPACKGGSDWSAVRIYPCTLRPIGSSCKYTHAYCVDQQLSAFVGKSPARGGEMPPTRGEAPTAQRSKGVPRGMNHTHAAENYPHPLMNHTHAAENYPHPSMNHTHAAENYPHPSMNHTHAAENYPH